MITTSGTGSRLGHFTRATNKALVRVGGRPAVSWIIDAYPSAVPLVVTVGHCATQVRDFLRRAYPDRNITTVAVDPFEGPGSSLGYSLLQAESLLQRPFIFHACDSIVFDVVPAPDHNWAMGATVQDGGRDVDVTQYRTQRVRDGHLCAVLEKGEQPFSAVHCGVVGIRDFLSFWRHLRHLYHHRSVDQGLSDVHVIHAMLHEGQRFVFVGVKQWFDIGNLEALHRADEAMTRHGR